MSLVGYYDMLPLEAKDAPARQSAPPRHRQSRGFSPASSEPGRWIWLLGLGWTVLVLLLLAASYHYARKGVVEFALREARTAYQKDLAYRYWNADQGGVYVRVSTQMPRNPFLQDIPERDVTTTSGQDLTLVNPAYMTRMVHGVGKSEFGMLAHITSLKPLNPANAPDPWEVEALSHFAAGGKETNALAVLQQTPHLRFMAPLVTQDRCLKCHAQQGYKTGDIRGGISVSVPTPGITLGAIARRNWGSLLGLAALWLAGMGMVGVVAHHVRHRWQERTAAEAEARAQEAKVRAVYESMTELLALHEVVKDDAGQVVDYRILDCNPAFTRVTGIRREQAIGQRATQVYGIQPPPYLETFAQVAATGKAVRFDTYFAPMGKHFSISCFSHAPGQFATVSSDVTDQKRYELELKRSELFARSIIENEPECVKILLPGGLLKYMNPAGLAMIEVDHLDQVRGQCVYPLVAPEYQAAFKELTEKVLRGERASLQFEMTGLKGTRRWMDTHAVPLHDEEGRVEALLGLTRDVTAHKHAENAWREAERRFRQAQKMEAIGQLAGGVAHDFNNILAATLMHLSLLGEDPCLGAEARETVAELKTQAERAAALTRQLLLFSRREVMQLRRVDLNELIDHLMKMLRRLLGEQIALVVRPDNTPLAVEADPGMLEQVITNLCVNARDAMPKGGTLDLLTQRVHYRPEDIADKPEARAGAFVCLQITDTGTGIPADILPRIFEPFFTTKEVGKGTGLGLATVHGIVKQHRGWVEVETQVGRGTIFRVYLPLAALPDQPAVDEQAVPAAGGTETILVVEDESSVRLAVVRVLKKLGYKILEATDGLSALRLTQGELDEIDLLFTDMVMPGGINGLELAKKLREQKPTLPVIITSGYSAELVASGAEVPSGVTYLPKPLNRTALAKTLRTMLDQR